MALRRAADPDKALAMQAYMKSAMPYHGVPVPVVRQISKEALAEATIETAVQWRAQVLRLWRDAQFREERYAALYLARDRRAQRFQTPSSMKMYEEMIVTGAWWDYVDEIASHCIGSIVRDHPAPMRRKLLSWSQSENLWKRRASILCQLGFKRETDLTLLYACIEPSLGSPEFFLQKAIGWALRQYAWTDPAEIKGYVRRNRSRLSALSLREALKNVG